MSLSTRIARLEDEVEMLRKERDRFKRIASNAEEQTAKQRIEYLTLEGEYEEEKRKRMNAEKLLDKHVSELSEPSLISDAKRPVKSSKVDVIETGKQSTANDGTQDIKKTNPNEVICVDSDVDSIRSFKVRLSVRARKQMLIKPKPKEVTTALDSITAPKIEKKRSVDQVSDIENLDQPVKKAPKFHIESKPSDSKPAMDAPPLKVYDDSTVIPAVVPSGTSNSTSCSKSDTSALPILVPKSESKEKGKVKAATSFVLRQSEALKYMEGMSAYIIDPLPNPPKVSRTCLTETYGLPGMGLLWISKDKQHRFLLPTYGVNPEMPRSPGEPGLLLSCRNEICDGFPWTVFIPVVEGKKARWIYVGEYIGETVGLLSSDDFKSHNEKVKVTWGQKIQKHKKYLVYCVLRARMTLRLGGGDPTDKEVENEVARIKRKDYSSRLTAQDVIDAFERGDEHISIVKLRCINYKHVLETELAAAQVRSDTREEDKRLLKKSGEATSGKSMADTKKRVVEKQGSTQKLRGRNGGQQGFELGDDSGSSNQTQTAESSRVGQSRVSLDRKSKSNAKKAWSLSVTNLSDDDSD